MREGHSGWNLAAQKITQRFPTLLNVVQQQFLWWNKGLDTMVVLTVSLTKNSSWPGICSAKSSIKIGIENKVDFSCCWGQHPVKFAVSHSRNKLKLIDQTFHPRIFFSFAQNYFTIRKSFQYFLPEKISGRVHKHINILVESFYIWLGAILKNIHPVIYEVQSLLFPVKNRKSKMAQRFGDWCCTSFSNTCTNYLHSNPLVKLFRCPRRRVIYTRETILQVLNSGSSEVLPRFARRCSFVFGFFGDETRKCKPRSREMRDYLRVSYRRID